jgi:outer membrane protein assembly factor BamB
MFRVAILVIVVGALRLTARADDWPMLGRDRTHNAVSPEKGAPTDWQNAVQAAKGADAKAARNIKWSAHVGNRALGGPVIANGLVWVGTNNAKPRDPRDTRVRKDGKREPIDMSVLMCFRESDGTFLWQYTSPRLPAMVNDGPWHGMGSTPLVEGDRLWIITNRCETLCLDVGPLRRGEGPPKEVWKVDMRKQFGVYPHADLMASGVTASTAADAERIFAVTGNGVDEGHINIPAPNAPSLVCFEKATGKTLWTDESPGKAIMHAQNSSPLVIETTGRTQVVVGQGDGWLRSFDAVTGKLVWKCDLNPKGAKYELGGRGRRNYATSTPIYYHGRIYIAPGQSPEHYDGESDLFCIDPTGRGDVSAELDDGQGKGKPNPDSRVVWRYGGPAPKGDESGEYVFGRTLASCAAHDGLVYACDIGGRAYCLDAKTGQLHWRENLKSSTWGGPLWLDGKVYFATEDGDVWIFAAGKEKRLMSKVEMGDNEIHVTPAFANDTLYVMTESMLYAIQATK